MTDFAFIDTLAVHGGLWSFDSGTLQAISNQWAAMPSLHLAWAAWCLASSCLEIALDSRRYVAISICNQLQYRGHG